jgi:tight adherence protein B
MTSQILIFIIIGVSIVFLFFGLRRVLRGQDSIDERLKVYAAMPETGRQRTQRARGLLARLRLRVNNTLSTFSSDEMVTKLMSANWPITVTEYTLIRLSGVTLGFGLGWLIAQNILGGIALAVMAYMIPGILLRNAINRRQRAFERQLVDVLVLMTGAVRAGFSLLQALEVIVREMKAPASEEFRRVMQEVAIGRPLTQALNGVVLRMENKDMELLTTAINIQYTVGGNLTTMLTAVAETIRERIRLFGEVRVLTTQQRMTAYILSLLPIFVAGLMFLINPEYMMGLFKPGFIFLPIMALIGIIFGFFIVRRLSRIDI